MPRNICWRCTLRLEARRQSPKLSSKQQGNPGSRTQIGKSRTLPQASELARISKYDFQKPTHSLIRHVPIGANSDVEKGARRSPRLSKRYSGHSRVVERWTSHRKSSTTSWQLRFGRGVWKPVTEASSSAAGFRDRVLGLINSDVMAMKVINQQRAFEKSLSLGRGNISRYSKSAKFGGTIYNREESSSVHGVHKRTFATHAHHQPETFAPPLSGSLAGFPQHGAQGEVLSKVRQDLASWQLEHNDTDTRLKAFLGLPQASLGTGMATKVDESLSSVDTGNSEEEETHGIDMESGDLVELIIDNRCTLAVFVKRFQRQLQFFTQFGSWIHLQSKRTIWFHVPGFVDPSELDPIRPYLPSVEVPLQLVGCVHSAESITPQHAGHLIMARMGSFIRQADTLYRDHAGKIDQAYDKVAYDKQYRWMHINDITRDVLGLESSDNIPVSTVWAVHRALILHDMGFIPEQYHHWKNGVYEILAKQDMDLVRQIRHWVREYQEFSISQACDMADTDSKQPPKSSVLADFARSVMPIIRENRLARPSSQSGDLGPSKLQVQPEPVAFRSIPLRAAKPSETLIFRFLEMWSARKTTRIGSPLWALGPMILRSTGAYREKDLLDLDIPMGYRFLQEVGVFTPWESKVAFNTRLALPGLNFDPQTESLLASASKRAEGFETHDTMSDLRQDWGDLEVFCIDDAGTREVDDGVSLEPVAGNRSCYWIHVHTANPSAFLDPGDAMAKYAEHLTQTIYFPDKVYSLLSPKVSREHFSLQPNRPVLTFSAKLSIEGDIIETRITPSRIHNVVFVSPGTTSDLLSPGAQGVPMVNYTVGHNPAPTRDYHSQRLRSSLTVEQVETLRTLSQLGKARRKKCTDSVVDEPYLKVLKNIRNRPALDRLPRPSVYYSQVEFPWRRVLRKIEGDPTIQVQTRMFQPSILSEVEVTEEAGQGPRLVHDLMVLAGEIGATWCAARSIPLIFQGTRKVEWNSTPEVTRRWQEACLPGQKGEALYLAADQFSRVGRKGAYSASAIKHEVLGTTAYARVTSPIRRFTDMIAHWQIQAALRLEARLGRPLTETDFPNLPFSKTRLDSLGQYIKHRESILMMSQTSSILHWCNLFMMRGYQFQEPVQPHALPEYLEGFMIWRNTQHWYGKVKELNLNFRIPIVGNSNSNIKHIETGDWWKVKVEDASPVFEYMAVEPLELISRL